MRLKARLALIPQPNMASSRPVRTARPSSRLTDKDNIANAELESHRNLVRAAQAEPSTSSANSPELSPPELSKAVHATSVPESNSGVSTATTSMKRAAPPSPCSDIHSVHSGNDSDAYNSQTTETPAPSQPKSKSRKKKKRNSATNTKATRQNVDDTEDEDSDGETTPSDPTKPWLSEFNLYATTHESVLDGMGIVRGWGVRVCCSSNLLDSSTGF